ncbi:MAG: flagellar hook-basal body complex protein FliE [Desulfovibrionaceae bacterium]
MEFATKAHTPMANNNSFTDTVKNSINKVSALQTEKASAIEDFAAGRTQNVHELMITLQKAGLAMSLTSAVRGKVLEAYKELSRMQF